MPAYEEQGDRKLSTNRFWFRQRRASTNPLKATLLRRHLQAHFRFGTNVHGADRAEGESHQGAYLVICIAFDGDERTESARLLVQRGERLAKGDFAVGRTYTSVG